MTFSQAFFAVQFTPSCLIAYGSGPTEVLTALVFAIISFAQSAFFKLLILIVLN